MDLLLKRTDYRSDGIFGQVCDSKKNIILMYCLEHAYLDNENRWLPKVQSGSYNCIRGSHRLEGMVKDFDTFEVTNVPGHKGILFHCGNFEKDSSGCILLGSSINKVLALEDVSTWALLASRDAFDRFMLVQAQCDQFNLTIEQ